MGLGEIILGEMGLGEMGLGEMGQNHYNYGSDRIHNTGYIKKDNAFTTVVLLEQ